MGGVESARVSKASTSCGSNKPQYAGGLHVNQGAATSQTDRDVVEDMDVWEDAKVLIQHSNRMFDTSVWAEAQQHHWEGYVK